MYSHYEGELDAVDLGQEVQFTLSGKAQSGGKISAENVKPLKKGSIPSNPVSDEMLEGVIVRPMRSVNPDQAQYAGLVKVGTDSKSR